MKKKEYEICTNQIIKAKDIIKFIRENDDIFIDICERDELIKIAINNTLPLEEIQKILAFSGKRKLYPYFRRDAILMHCIYNNLGIKETNNALRRFNEKEILNE